MKITNSYIRSLIEEILEEQTSQTRAAAVKRAKTRTTASGRALMGTTAAERAAMKQKRLAGDVEDPQAAGRTVPSPQVGTEDPDILGKSYDVEAGAKMAQRSGGGTVVKPSKAREKLGVPPAKKKGTGPSTGSPAVRKHKAKYVKAWKAMKAGAPGGNWKKLPYGHDLRRAVRDAKERLDNTKKISKNRELARSKRTTKAAEKASGREKIRGTMMGKKLAKKGKLKDPGKRVVRKRPTVPTGDVSQFYEHKENSKKKITKSTLQRIIKEELQSVLSERWGDEGGSWWDPMNIAGGAPQAAPLRWATGTGETAGQLVDPRTGERTDVPAGRDPGRMAIAQHPDRPGSGPAPSPGERARVQFSPEQERMRKQINQLHKDGELTREEKKEARKALYTSVEAAQEVLDRVSGAGQEGARLGAEEDIAAMDEEMRYDARGNPTTNLAVAGMIPGSDMTKLYQQRWQEINAAFARDFAKNDKLDVWEQIANNEIAKRINADVAAGHLTDEGWLAGAETNTYGAGGTLQKKALEKTAGERAREMFGFTEE